MKGIMKGYTNGGGGKVCCSFIGTTGNWGLYIEVVYVDVDVKVQWRDLNEASLYIRCMCFMSRFASTIMCSIHFAGQGLIFIEIS
jgi:hypothetical protein